MIVGFTNHKYVVNAFLFGHQFIRSQPYAVFTALMSNDIDRRSDVHKIANFGLQSFRKGLQQCCAAAQKYGFVESGLCLYGL